MNRWKISVIVAVYNAELYIEECARSLFRQSMLEVEYIFVNDGSSDNSIALLERMLDGEFRNRRDATNIINLSVNKGISNARNIGLRNASGDYVIHVDSDDWIDEDMFERLYKVALMEDADIVGCNYYNEYATCTQLRVQCYSTDKYECIRNLLIGTLFPSLCMSIVRHDIYLKSGLVFPVGDDMGEDLWANIVLYWYADKVSNIGTPLYHYRHTNLNSVCFIKDNKAIESDIRLAERIEYFLVEKTGHQFAIEIECRKFLSKLPLWSNRKCRDYKRWLSLYPKSHVYVLRYSALDWKMKVEYWLAIHKMPCMADMFTAILRFQHRVKTLFS